MPHCRRRHHDHAVAGQPVAPAEVYVVADAGQCRVEPAQLLEGIAADEHARGVHGEEVAAAVVLALVHLVQVDHGQPFGAARYRQTDVDQLARILPVHLLAAGNGNRRRGLHGEQQFFQRVRFRGGVIMQQPHPFLHAAACNSCGCSDAGSSSVRAAGSRGGLAGSPRRSLGIPLACRGRAGSLRQGVRLARMGGHGAGRRNRGRDAVVILLVLQLVQGNAHRRAESGPGRSLDHGAARRQRLFQERNRGVGGAGVHADVEVGRPGLRVEGSERLGQVFGTVVGDNNGGNANLLVN
ncbi:hypothetical protein SAMN04489742_0660 [Arthrobacter crystallopoietes]|uniref:Uncharacterized protein n=1 Tax=Crystallibacter crystallopoietes TaxID=37928 RepID=A0A1H1A0N6_9MICC|nr:hypothetical protein SAMN04489742_0660 [Arthrobacter crystallopoietes]